MEWLIQLLPGPFVEWLRIYIAPFFKLQIRAIFHGLLWGIADTLLFITLPLGISLGSQAFWSARYHLTITQQQQVERWSNAARLIAYLEDVPPVTPLVLWFKEGGLQESNPTNCEGIMGLYTDVTTGRLPCFPAGALNAREVLYQMQLGARTFKTYCPEVHFNTVDPRILKKCYLRYNAGPSAQTDPNQSAYVMNGYDEFHKDMVHTDIQGRKYRLTALGAWPTHLAMQAQLAQRETPIAPLAFLAPMMLGQEVWDRLWIRQENITPPSDVVLDDPAQQGELFCREAEVRECFVAPHVEGNPELRPAHSPLLLTPESVSEPACGLLPGIEMAASKPSIVLAPVSGQLRRYVDGLGHLAVQIENEEWTVWITGLRSYNAPEGAVKVGTPIGAIGGVGSSTPDIHYAIYDQNQAGFVDTLSFLPVDACVSIQ